MSMKLQMNDQTSNINEKTPHPCYFQKQTKDKFYPNYKFINEILTFIKVWQNAKDKLFLTYKEQDRFLLNPG